ncbi:MAG: hypothetical protein K8U03_12260 [Planctomycetia bacterium]|nr:hypothetical protein [Planctomycetia bacterium]
MPDASRLWLFLPLGYLLTVAIELPVLRLLLSRRHTTQLCVVAGFWLTAVTYPIVVVALPLALGPYVSRGIYLAIAETFVPLAECVLFYFAYVKPLPRNAAATRRDCAAIVLANLASFGCGELFWYLRSTAH